MRFYSANMTMTNACNLFFLANQLFNLRSIYTVNNNKIYLKCVKSQFITDDSDKSFFPIRYTLFDHFQDRATV